MGDPDPIPFNTSKATLANCCFTVCAAPDSVDRACGYTKGKTTVATLTEVNGRKGVAISTTMTWAQFLKKEGQ